MLKYLFLFIFSILSSTHASSVDDLKNQTKKPLYFTIPIQSYEMVEKGKINLKIQLASDSITVMTDRPYRQKKTIKSSEFVDYIMENSQKDLVFTLSIQKNGQPFLINFKKQKTLFSSDTNEVIFENIQISKDVSDQLRKTKNVKGTNAVLIVEG